ncbi:MAG: EAL domain-containing protein, partial [Actinomycetia bacterium]|nr:EAL domain-containing protein [Actinomycetes bacterium]
ATNADDEAIVRATIGLGHDLGLEIVAEGVEDSQTLDLLRSLGCDRIQGYFIGRPVSSDAFAALALRMTGGVGNVRPLRPNRTA